MELSKYKENQKTKFLADEYERLLQKKEEALALADDESMKELAEEEVAQVETQLDALKQQMDEILESEKEEIEFPNEVILEIRAGAGGDEASLFAAELANMYIKYAENKGWGVKKVSESMTEAGGYKEVSAEIRGQGVFKKLMNETGVHRVQRVPATEKMGRIHTSTASVAILPIRKQSDFKLNMDELEFETSRSGGKGGQNVNKVETAVRVIHKPTGLDVRSTAERSQIKNKERAISILSAKLEEIQREEEDKKFSDQRKKQIGTNDRSEKIRTYNFPQNRITDHRISKSWHNIEEVMVGQMDDIIEALEQANADLNNTETDQEKDQ
jgi:peptide chain release factor 1